VDGAIDLNADVGEVDDPDLLESQLFEVVTSANIATGAHAGNPSVMDAAVECASRLGVRVGAHPSFPDREGFGRRVIDMDRRALRAELIAQIGALDAIARSRGEQLLHVKPHGALYHLAAADDDYSRMLAEVVANFDGVALVVPAGAPGTIAESLAVRVLFEAFADRGYHPDGTLVARGEPGDLITDPGRAAEQAVSIATEKRVRTSDGTWLAVSADTLCLHGDTPGAPLIGREVREALENAGVRVQAPPR
jgi:UPF0271 protein